MTGDELQAENERLRELYENAVGNRERFGWTINHLLECEDALLVAQERLATQEAALRFYADRQTYEVSGPLDGGAWGSAPYPIFDDGGKQAREALGMETDD